MNYNLEEMLFTRMLRRAKIEFSNALPIIKSKKVLDNVVVSLTSYPARLKNLHVVIRSLLHQTVLPKKIILYLGTDTKESDIPDSLKKLQKKYGDFFEIRKNCENIRPHKKYFYSMQEFSEEIVITVDDDLIYDRNLIRDLHETHKKYPKCVCARRVNLITKDSSGNAKKYNDWEWECRKVTEPSLSLLATGCGGVLYPPHLLPKETFDIESIKAHCLNTDDIWLKFMEMKNKIPVVWTNSKVVHPLSVRNSQESGLLQTNTKGENRNDTNIKAMEKFTGIKLIPSD